MTKKEARIFGHNLNRNKPTYDILIGNFFEWKVYQTRAAPILYYGVFTPQSLMFGKTIKTMAYSSIGKLKARIVQIHDDMNLSLENVRDKNLGLERYLHNFWDNGETDAVELNSEKTISELFGNYNMETPRPRVELTSTPFDQNLTYREISSRTVRQKSYIDKIIESEEALRARPNMSARMLDENGDVVLDKTGDERKRIKFDNMERGILDFYKDNGVFMHTHKGTYDPMEGFSFTIADLQKAIVYNLPEFRIVTHYGTYVLLRPDNGWGCTPGDIHKVYTGIKYRLQPEFDKELQAMTERANHSQVNTSAWDITYRKFIHMIMKELSKKFGFQYYFVPRTAPRHFSINGGL